jgi:hypothetical protein
VRLREHSRVSQEVLRGAVPSLERAASSLAGNGPRPAKPPPAPAVAAGVRRDVAAVAARLACAAEALASEVNDRRE